MIEEKLDPWVLHSIAICVGESAARAGKGDKPIYVKIAFAWIEKKMIEELDVSGAAGVK
jgi:hypothetical protein